MPRMRRIIEPGMAYFVTTNVLHRRKIFYSSRNAMILIKTIYKFRDRGDFHLIGFVIMPDHLHLMVVPLDGQTISKVMEKIKSSSSKQLSKTGVKGPIWLKRFYDKV
jgi:putative transposase